ncbi:MAG: hypothetical protein HYY18_15885 [Planctomycetes bacterium]|nr:hypothetical protein [Planctomycetota bacterium]
MKRFRALALGFALSAPLGADEVAVPMADGSVLRGERVDDPSVSARGLRLRTGGVTVFVPWEEIEPQAARLLRDGGRPEAPLAGPPVAPGPGEVDPPPCDEEVPVVPGEPPALPDCCDPRY